MNFHSNGFEFVAFKLNPRSKLTRVFKQSLDINDLEVADENIHKAFDSTIPTESLFRSVLDCERE